VRFVDLDSDGALDILVGLGRPGVRIAYGDGTGAFDDRDEAAFALLAEAIDMAFGDLDADGERDLVAVHGQNNLSEWMGVSGPLLSGKRRRWERHGDELPGAAGHATLGGFGTLEAGDPVRVLLRSALPGAPATLVVSLSALDFPMLGGVLVPAPDFLLGGMPVDAGGVLELSGTWPAGVPGGVEVFLQAWFPDVSTTWGWAASPGLVMVTP
jgi:hypothetical protein